jgi:hypothetical protein
MMFCKILTSPSPFPDASNIREVPKSNPMLKPLKWKSRVPRTYQVGARYPSEAVQICSAIHLTMT